jgi:DNA-binding MarR family transcriptional regulator
MSAARRKVTKSDYEALAAFRHALRRFVVFSEGAAAAEGVPPQQHQALLAIKGHPSGEAISIGELAESLVIRHNTAVELSDRLDAAGLVTRRQSTEDRRRMLLSLTPKADAVLAQLSATHLDELRQITPLLIDLLRRFQPLDEPAPAGTPTELGGSRPDP